MSTRRIALRSPLDPLALARRMQSAVSDRIDADTPAGVLGRGSEREMTLFYHRPRRRNDFRSTLVAAIDPDGTGSRIVGRIGMPRGTRIFVGCWFTFLALFAVAALGFALVFARIAPAPLFLAIPLLLVGVPLTMMAFGIVLLRGGRRDAAHDEAAILAFLALTVDAHPIA